MFRRGTPLPILKGSADLLEDRRKRALALLDSGYSLNEVGRRIGCNASSVMRWRDARRRSGEQGLRVRFSPGRPLKLDRKQRRRLVTLLLQGPMMHGHRTNLWTTARKIGRASCRESVYTTIAAWSQNMYVHMTC